MRRRGLGFMLDTSQYTADGSVPIPKAPDSQAPGSSTIDLSNYFAQIWGNPSSATKIPAASSADDEEDLSTTDKIGAWLDENSPLVYGVGAALVGLAILKAFKK